MNDARRGLESIPVPTGVRLSLLWASLMFLYIYNDYFSMYMPHVIEGMSQGRMGPLGPATDAVMIGVSLLLAVPALMIFLSTGLAPGVSRWLNVILGLVYTVVEVMTFGGPRLFYSLVVGIEIVLSLLIVWFAARWPRAA